VSIDFDLFRRMLRHRRDADAGPWFVSPEFEDDSETKCVSIGPRPGSHYEDTIAQFFGMNGSDHLANAAFVAFVATHAEDMCVEIEKMRRLVDGVEEAAVKDDFAPLVALLADLSSEKGYKVIKPRSEDARHPSGNKKLFLAGSIDNGTAEDWQRAVEGKINDLAVTVYNPRRDDWNPDLKQDISEPEFAYQVNWELDNIAAADVIFVYFSPGGPAPITLMELGTMTASKAKVIVCCPDGYWRKGNVQVLCHRHGMPLFDNLEDAVSNLRYQLNS
jgi:hypothetical protein